MPASTRATSWEIFKEQSACERLVRAEGLEPSFTVSETGVLAVDEARKRQWVRRESDPRRVLKKHLLDLRAADPSMTWDVPGSNRTPAA